MVRIWELMTIIVGGPQPMIG